MRCPHCLVNFHVSSRTTLNFNTVKDDHIHLLFIGEDTERYWWMEKVTCPACGKFILRLVSTADARRTSEQSQSLIPSDVEHITAIRPRGTNRPPVPVEVPEDFAEDYREACLVIADSPKASAALSRRCLQHILREKAGVKNPNDLAKAIQEVVDSHAVPSDISETLDMVRNIGNFSAHPNKSVNTGEIVDVEPQEAEWCLETIEILFEYYFVRPADIGRRKRAVNEKLAEIGKPQMPVTDQIEQPGN